MLVLAAAVGALSHHIRLTAMSHSYFELLVEVNGTIGSSGTWVLRLRVQQQ